jgi:hypothetical protein
MAQRDLHDGAGDRHSRPLGFASWAACRAGSGTRGHEAAAPNTRDRQR